MKYLVNIESLDYTRQRELEKQFKIVYLENEHNDTEVWIIIDDAKKAEKMEETIRDFNELFKI